MGLPRAHSLFTAFSAAVVPFCASVVRLGNDSGPLSVPIDVNLSGVPLQLGFEAAAAPPPLGSVLLVGAADRDEGEGDEHRERGRSEPMAMLTLSPLVTRRNALSPRREETLFTSASRGRTGGNGRPHAPGVSCALTSTLPPAATRIEVAAASGG